MGGHRREEVRLLWWDQNATTFRKAALGMDGREDEIPDSRLPLVDDDDGNLPGAYIVQQLLKAGAFGGPAGASPVVIAGADQSPAGMGLALDIGGASSVFRIA